MRLIEKNCPNCGASLEFNDTDKSCKCKYCHSAFEIERDENEKEDLEKSIRLKKLEGPLKLIGLSFIGSYFITAVIFILIFVVSLFVIFKGIHSMDGKILFRNADEITNEQLSDLDNKAYWTIYKNDDGIHNYHLNMNVKRQEVYVGYQKDKKKDIIISVYKATYEKPLDRDNIYSIYVPIAYENIYNNSSFVFQLNNGKIEAPPYYFNSEHSEYSYGYQTLEEVYEKYIKKFEKNYEITKK